MPKTKKEEIENRTVADDVADVNTAFTKVLDVATDAKLEIRELTENEKKLLFLRKKQNLRKALLGNKFIMDGYNIQQSYEYVKAYQFKEALSKTCLEVGLEYTVSTVNSIFENMTKSDKMYLTTVIVDITLIDVDTGYESKPCRIITTGADNLDKGNYKAYTMVAKTYLQTEFGLSGKNDEDCEADILETKIPKFVSPAKKEELTANVVKASKTEPTGELTTPEFLNEVKEAIMAIRAVAGNETYGEKTLCQIATALDSGVMPSQSEMTNKMLAIEKKYSEVVK